MRIKNTEKGNVIPSRHIDYFKTLEQEYIDSKGMEEYIKMFHDSTPTLIELLDFNDKKLIDNFPKSVYKKINTYKTKYNSKRRVIKYLGYWIIRMMLDEMVRLAIEEDIEIIMFDSRRKDISLKAIRLNMYSRYKKKININLFSKYEPIFANWDVKINYHFIKNLNKLDSYNKYVETANKIILK